MSTKALKKQLGALLKAKEEVAKPLSKSQKIKR